MVRLPFSKGALGVGLFILSVSLLGCYTMLRHPTVSQPPPIHPDSAATYSHDSGYNLSCTDCHNNQYDHRRNVHYWNDWDWYPNYYTGYMGWRRYYWRPWWYDHYYRYPYGYYYGGGGGGGGGSGDPPSKRTFGRRDSSNPPPGGPPVYTSPPVQQPQQPQSPPSPQQPSSGKRTFPKSQDNRDQQDDQDNKKRGE